MIGGSHDIGNYYTNTSRLDGPDAICGVLRDGGSEDTTMKFIIFVLVLIVGITLVAAYACLVAASEADERAEQIFKEYMEYKKKHQ